MIDYATVLRSPSFKFFIGEDAECFTVPRALFKDVSDPLHTMINNERLKESIDGEANINDCDGKVFAAFCQYCFTGKYDVPYVAIDELENPERWEDRGYSAKAKTKAKVVAEDSHSTKADLRACRCGAAFVCHMCGSGWSHAYLSRYCDCGGDLRCIDCGTYRGDITAGLPAQKPCHKKSRKKGVSSVDTPHTNRYSTHRAYYDGLWESFEASVQVACLGEPAATRCDTEDISYVEYQPLVFHCKVFVLAEKYLASPLMKLAARKLHNGLLEMPREMGSIHDIIPVLTYCFPSTGESTTSPDGALAKMVIAYAAARMPELKEIGEFRISIAGNSVMASQLVMVLG